MARSNADGQRLRAALPSSILLCVRGRRRADSFSSLRLSFVAGQIRFERRPHHAVKALVIALMPFGRLSEFIDAFALLLDLPRHFVNGGVQRSGAR